MVQAKEAPRREAEGGGALHTARPEVGPHTPMDFWSTLAMHSPMMLEGSLLRLCSTPIASSTCHTSDRIGPPSEDRLAGTQECLAPKRDHEIAQRTTAICFRPSRQDRIRNTAFSIQGLKAG